MKKTFPGHCSGLPSETRQGFNSWGRTGYGGPCPPIGRHRYFFKPYVLNCFMPDLGQDELLKHMQGHVLAETVLMGIYQHRP